MSIPEGDPAAVDTMIAEVLANSADLAQAAFDNARLLGELFAARPDGDAAARRAEHGDGGPLTPDLLEIVTLQARAAGVSPNEYLRRALLAYAARSDSAPADDDRDVTVGDRGGGG